jgi:hypothetical protein
MSPHVLIVACRTAVTPGLLDAVAERAGAGPARFTLLVPRPCHGLHRVVDPEDHGWIEAEAVIATALPVLSEATGTPVQGRIGSHDPLAAVLDVLNAEQVDEVIVSTLPTRLSHWLRLDLPAKVAATGVPVTTVTAPSTAPLALAGVE